MGHELDRHELRMSRDAGPDALAAFSLQLPSCRDIADEELEKEYVEIKGVACGSLRPWVSFDVFDDATAISARAWIVGATQAETSYERRVQCDIGRSVGTPASYHVPCSSLAYGIFLCLVEGEVYTGYKMPLYRSGVVIDFIFFVKGGCFGS